MQEKKHADSTPPKSFGLFDQKNPDVIDRKLKDRFYEKKRDLYGHTYFNEQDTGCIFHIANKYDSPKRIKAKHYDHPTYFYFKKEQILLYIADETIEHVAIDNLEKFEIHVEKIMNTKSRRYEYKLLSYEEIYVLIALNGGHLANKNPEFQASLSMEKIEQLKIFLENEPIPHSSEDSLASSEASESSSSSASDEDEKPVLSVPTTHQAHFFMGGPPSRPPRFGNKITVDDEEIKIDEEGRCYVGISLKEWKSESEQVMPST